MRALVRPTSPTANLSGLDLETVTGDLNDPAGYAGAIQGARYVFHAAADYRLWAPDAGPMYRTNVEGTRVVLEAAAKAGVERIVYTSSVAALKAVPGRLADETDFYASEEGIIGHYKRSKYQAELQALELARRGFPVVIVNPAAPIGPRDIKPTPTGRIITDFLNGKLPAYIDTGLNAVHVDDVAYGHWLATSCRRRTSPSNRFSTCFPRRRVCPRRPYACRITWRWPPRLWILRFPTSPGAFRALHGPPSECLK